MFEAAMDQKSRKLVDHNAQRAEKMKSKLVILTKIEEQTVT